MSRSTQSGRWDGPWYRVHTEHFDAAFLPNAGEDLESVNNVDVFVDLEDGSRWSATIITLGQVEVVMARWAESGEAQGGRYFWCSDGLIVREPGIDNMTQVLTGLIESGEYAQIFHRLEVSGRSAAPGAAGPTPRPRASPAAGASTSSRPRSRAPAAATPTGSRCAARTGCPAGNHGRPAAAGRDGAEAAA